MSQKNDRRRRTASDGEDEAADFLRAAGWHLIERNWHCRGGELDIIAERDDVLAFVEVRTAATRPGVRPEDTVVGIKTARLVRAAKNWLVEHRDKAQQRVLRFDVIGIERRPDGTRKLRHYPAAFTPKDFC